MVIKKEKLEKLELDLKDHHLECSNSISIDVKKQSEVANFRRRSQEMTELLSRIVRKQNDPNFLYFRSFLTTLLWDIMLLDSGYRNSGNRCTAKET